MLMYSLLSGRNPPRMKDCQLRKSTSKSLAFTWARTTTAFTRRETHKLPIHQAYEIDSSQGD